MTIGHIHFSAIPGGWEILEGCGLRRKAESVFPSNVIVVRDQLTVEQTLQQYIESQKQHLLQYLVAPEIEAPKPTIIEGADEAVEMVIRHVSQDRQAIYQQQVYARCGQQLSVITFTTTVKDLPAVQIHFLAIKAGLIIETTRNITAADQPQLSK